MVRISICVGVREQGSGAGRVVTSASGDGVRVLVYSSNNTF